MTKKYLQVTTSEELTAAMARVRAAQEKFASYTQEQVDKIFLAAATAANPAAPKAADDDQDIFNLFRRLLLNICNPVGFVRVALCPKEATI